MTLKELKTAYNVLCDLDFQVPTDLLVHIAQKIRTTESRNAERRLSRMTEEQLILLENRQRHTLRIYTADDRLIQRKTNEATFREAIKEIDPERVASLGLMVGRKPLVIRDMNSQRKRIKKYVLIKPGYFLLGSSTSAEKLKVLKTIDEQLELGWEIELV